jgi:hypothetical protein
MQVYVCTVGKTTLAVAEDETPNEAFRNPQVRRPGATSALLSQVRREGSGDIDVKLLLDPLKETAEQAPARVAKVKALIIMLNIYVLWIVGENWK